LEQEASDERAQADGPDVRGADERYAEEADDAKRRLPAAAERFLADIGAGCQRDDARADGEPPRQWRPGGG
jgi:hypothetical protein